jgi:hypothetical protein
MAEDARAVRQLVKRIRDRMEEADGERLQFERECEYQAAACQNGRIQEMDWFVGELRDLFGSQVDDDTPEQKANVS